MKTEATVAVTRDRVTTPPSMMTTPTIRPTTVTGYTSP